MHNCGSAQLQHELATGELQREFAVVQRRWLMPIPSESIMASAARTRMTSQEYLAQERKAEFRSEFYCGETFAMAGASRSHNLICTNLRPELQ